MSFVILSAFLMRACFVLGAVLGLRRILGDRLSAAARFQLLLASIIALPALALLPSFGLLRSIGLGPGSFGTIVSGQGFEEVFLFTGKVGAIEPRGTIPVPGFFAAVFSSVWAAGALILVARTFYRRIVSGLAVRRLNPCRDRAWHLALERAESRLGRSFPLRVYSGPYRSPFVVGTRGRSIVVPLDGSLWTQDRREAVMLHELGHVQRRDLQLMTIAELLAAAVWCLPFMPHLMRTLVDDREEACDALALKAGARPSEYASLMLDLLSARPSTLPPGSQGAAGGRGAGRRIRRIVEGKAGGTGSGILRKLSLALLIVFVAVAGAFPAMFAVENHDAKTTLRLRFISEDGHILTGIFEARAVPQGMPLRGAWGISLPFGTARNPFTGRLYTHTGIDLSNSKTGDIVEATMDGRVVETGYEQSRGNYVVLGNGDTLALFYHLETVRVGPGDRVGQGAVIGTVGESGRATGPHLHYEVRIHGIPVDPAGIFERYSNEYHMLHND